MKKTIAALCFVLLLVPLDMHAMTDEENYAATVAALTQYLARTFSLFDVTAQTPEEMRSIISAGTTWLKNAQESDGHFAYEYQPFTDTYLRGDNIVRQAGTLYELGEIYRSDPSDPLQVRQSIETSLDYFFSLSQQHKYNGQQFACIHASESDKSCKLGATSLALIGLLSYARTTPEIAKEYETYINDYVSYILTSRKDDGGFRNRYVANAGVQPEAESPFSNGEALLALVRYYQYAPDPQIATAINESFVYLKEQPFDTALYLWIMAALKDMQGIWDNEEYTRYAEEFTAWRMNRATMQKGTEHNYCAYAEGVASAYSVLEGNISVEELSVVRQELNFWNQKNALLQITENDTVWYTQTDGSLTRHEITNVPQAYGGFLTGLNTLTQRIDFTQHCISAYLQVLTDIDEEPLSTQ